jgi:hypothetical protein
MQNGQKQFLEKQYDAREWRSHSKHEKRAIKDFSFEQWQVPNWKLQRVRRDEGAKPTAIRSLWSYEESTAKLLSVDVFECPSVEAAHDQLLEALGNIESTALERRTGKDGPGDVAFGLNDTMILFVRVNVVVLIRNAGPNVVRVGDVAHNLDGFLLRHLEPKRTKEKK